jgi:hypothetical protein
MQGLERGADASTPPGGCRVTAPTLALPPGKCLTDIWPYLRPQVKTRWLKVVEREAPVRRPVLEVPVRRPMQIPADPAAVIQARRDALLAETRIAAPRPRDVNGRLVWTDEEMRAARSAYWRHRRHGGPALTAAQRDALNASRRQEEAARAAQRGKPLLSRPWRLPTETVTQVERMLTKGATARQVAEALDRAPLGVRSALRRAGRPDLARLFGRVSARGAS